MPTTRELNLLLVEDNPGDASLVRAYLAENLSHACAVTHVTSLAAAVEHLKSSHPDLVLLDLSLPDSRGLETFRQVNQQAPQVPIIVMSGVDDEDLAALTVHEGAQDYLPKTGLDGRLLGRSIRYSMERKHIEDALAHERDLLYTIIDNVPDRIFIKDQQSRFLKTNQSLARRFGLAHPREMVGKSDSDFFAQGHADLARIDEHEIMRTGRPMLDKIECETLPDGSSNWVITSKLPLRDKTGRLLGTFGISRDITALKQAEQTLNAERNLLRSLIDNLPDYIYAKDVECRYTLDNEAHRRLLGVSRMEEIIGKKVTDFFPEHLASKYDADDQMIIRTGRPMINHVERAVDRSGNPRWHCSTKIPLRNDAGDLSGLVCITRDVTETHEAQEKLETANVELGKNREELMRALSELQASHRQLKDAQGQLIQAEKLQSIGRLAAGVAHEVKNPLAIIRMGLDHLTQEIAETNVEGQLTLRDMREAIQRADGIILGLLDFARPRELNTKPHDLNSVVEQTVSMVRLAAKKSKVKLVREIAPDLPSIWIDPDKIKQVLLNLVTNSIHAVSQEGGTVTVRTRLKTLEAEDISTVRDARVAHAFHAGQQVILLEVRDNGPGIPADKISQIFDPFFTTKEPGKGTGLGLSVTRKLVEMHGGILEIRNRKSGGVVASIWLKV